jgi:hypothetical protein
MLVVVAEGRFRVLGLAIIPMTFAFAVMSLIGERLNSYLFSSAVLKSRRYRGFIVITRLKRRISNLHQNKVKKRKEMGDNTL